MNLNDYIANIVSLTEYCDDKETKNILLNHLNKLLDLRISNFNKNYEEPKTKNSVTFDCAQCNFGNKVDNIFTVNGVYALRCKACGYYNTVNT